MLNQKKLDTFASVLTPRERAILKVRAWCEGRAADHRLVEYCPTQDRAEFERITGALTRVSDEHHGCLIVWLEWLACLEQQIECHRVIRIYDERLKQIENLVAKPLPPMRQPWMRERQVPVGWGILLPSLEPEPPTWGEFLDQQVRSIHRSLGLRWQDVANINATFDELERVVGERLIQEQAEVKLGQFREHLERLTGEMAELGHPFTPETDPGRVSGWVDQFDWDAMRGKGDDDQRARMHETNRAKLEEFEREQAAMLRNGS